uniref:Putative secreted protein n=1 Tax=Ixodes ricinus TaxID=34613 RepID=A0A6B0V1E0_IXORI
MSLLAALSCSVMVASSPSALLERPAVTALKCLFAAATASASFWLLSASASTVACSLSACFCLLTRAALSSSMFFLKPAWFLASPLIWSLVNWMSEFTLVSSNCFSFSSFSSASRRSPVSSFRLRSSSAISLPMSFVLALISSIVVWDSEILAFVSSNLLADCWLPFSVSTYCQAMYSLVR